MSDKLIILLEDNEEIQRANRRMLELSGYKVETAFSQAQAQELLAEIEPDLMVVDIMLPDGNGLEFVKKVRGRHSMPILFLSALGEKADIVSGLRAGGDDYLSKPYDYEEFLARIEALLRRCGQENEPETVLQLGPLKMDLISGRAYLNDEDILLKPKEFALLCVLVRNHPRFMTLDELFKSVWSLTAVSDLRTVTVHISKLRHKLGYNASLTVESSRGRGYRLVFKNIQ